MRIKQNAVLILCVMAIPVFISCTSGRQQNDQSPTELKLIAYNVWYGFTLVPDRKELFLTWMEDQAPDVVCLEELNEYTPEKLENDARRWNHAYSVLLKEEGFPTGITSRFPIEETRKYREGFHHGLIRAKILDIYFYVIHLHPSNWETRGIEIDKILEDIRNLPDGSRVILAGDFNTFSPVDSVYYGPGKLEPFFRQRDEEFNEKNLKDGKLDYSVIQKILDNGLVDLEYRFRDSGYVFTGSFPTRIEKEGEHGDPRRLDYVFVSPELAEMSTGAEVVANDTTWYLSDHLPVVVNFVLK